MAYAYDPWCGNTHHVEAADRLGIPQKQLTTQEWNARQAKALAESASKKAVQNGSEGRLGDDLGLRRTTE